MLPAVRRSAPLLTLLAALAPLAAAADPGAPRATTNLSAGIRFEPPLTAIAQAPADPATLYIGTAHGRIHRSRDGGRTWDESTALVRRGAFYGAIRKQGPIDGFVDGPLALAPYSDTRAAGFRLPSDLYDDLGSYSGLEGLDARADTHPGDASVRELTGLGSLSKSSPVSAVRETFAEMVGGPGAGGEGDDDGAGSELAVGLRASAPRLAYQIRRKRGFGVGINLQQTLALRATPATAIHYLDVDPDDPDRVLAATADGLHLSRDGGVSWPLVLTGPTAPERTINHIARHPRRPTTIWIGTARGLHQSTDDGEHFDPLEHPLAATADVRWIDFHPTDEATAYVGVSWGLLRTTDGGRSFTVAYMSPWPPQSLARQVQIDPHQPDRVWLATADGLMRSDDAGQSWDRAGGLLFVGEDVLCLAPGPAPGHLVAVTAREIWETRDGGAHWQIAFFGTMQWPITYGLFDAGRPDTLLVLTQAELLRHGPAAPRALPPVVLDRARRVLAAEPTQREVLTAALHRAGLDREDRLAHRESARAAGYLPVLAASFALYRAPWERLFVNEEIATGEGRERGPIQGGAWFVGLTASWDLQSTVFHRAEAPIERIGRVNADAERALRATVIHLYQERRRLVVEAITAADDPRAALMRALRIEELTAHLNALAGDLFAPAPAL